MEMEMLCTTHGRSLQGEKRFLFHSVLTLLLREQGSLLETGVKDHTPGMGKWKLEGAEYFCPLPRQGPESPRSQRTSLTAWGSLWAWGWGVLAASLGGRGE